MVEGCYTLCTDTESVYIQGGFKGGTCIYCHIDCLLKHGSVKVLQQPESIGPIYLK